MAEKLARSPQTAAIGVRVRTSAYVPCYGATMSYYGSVPATFATDGTDGTEAYPFLIITEASNLDTMIESETRTGNYDLYRSAADNPSIATSMPVYAFVCRFGPLLLDGQICRLAEFQADRSEGYSQRDVLARLLEELGYSLSPDQLMDKIDDKVLWSELRDQIRDRLGSEPSLQGFNRVD